MFRRSKTTAASIETKPLKLPSLMLALEPRYVFDAALSSEIFDAAHDAAVATPDAGEPTSAEKAASLVAAARQHDADRLADSPDADAGTDAQVGALVEAMVVAHNLAPRGSEIAFIDSRLSDLAGLIGAIPEGTRIVLVDAGRDGVAAMIDALASEKDITGIHIISHGSAGSLQLGAATLDAGTMAGLYREALQSLGTHLSDEADILVYGCNFGEGDSGQAATTLLAELTGADVASSDDLTGAAELGGDWDLEIRHGFIEAGIVEAMKWNGVLDPFNISATTAPVVRDNTGAIVTAASTTIGGVVANRHITDVTKMVGATVVWANAGFVGSTAIDLRATVLSVIDTNPNAGNDPGLHFTISNGDDPSVRIDNAEVRIRWDAFEAGTYDPATGTGTVAAGDVGFFIRDIDALGHIYNASGVKTYQNITGIKPQESVRADFDELSNYQTEALANTHLTVGLNIDPDTGATVTDPLHSSFGKITATNLTDTELAQAVSGIKFNWNAVSAWEVTYRVAPPPGPVNLDLVPTNGTVDATIAGTNHGQRFFDHDGDGDLSFAAPYTVDMRHLDLDGNDSTAAGDDYQATFTENGTAVEVVDTASTSLASTGASKAQPSN